MEVELAAFVKGSLCGELIGCFYRGCSGGGIN